MPWRIRIRPVGIRAISNPEETSSATEALRGVFEQDLIPRIIRGGSRQDSEPRPRLSLFSAYWLVQRWPKLVHADLFEIEALIHSTGWSAPVAKQSYYQLIHEAIDLYGQDLPNLRKRSMQEGHRHDAGKQEVGYWPSPSYLRDRTLMGSQNRGQKFIGEENGSPGSDMIIQLADEEDDRPLWITVWGGGNTLAQAIWDVEKN